MSLIFNSAKDFEQKSSFSNLTSSLREFSLFFYDIFMLHLQQYLSESKQQEILQHCREIGKKSPLFRFWAGRNPGSFF